ncbi:MAG: phosphatase PAP2 family protein [Acidimicrobiales bacterium]
MLILLTIATGLVAGGIVSVFALRWPNSDPGSPKLDPAAIGQEVRRHPRFRALLKARLDPTKATGLLLTVALVLVVGGGIGIGVLLAMIRTNAGVARWDLRLARFGADHATKFSTDGLRLLTRLGSTEVVLPLAVVIGVLEFRRIASRALAFFLALTVLGQVAMSNLIKALVNRARPDIDRLTGFSGPSFPSGHATTAAASYAAFALLLGRRRTRRTKAILSGVAAGITVVVALTRVLLGVHWLTDVLGGIALGWGWFALCSIAFGGRLLRFGAPAEVAANVAETVPSTQPVHS